MAAHTPVLSAQPPAGLRWWQQTPVSAWHVCLPHPHLPGEGFQGFTCPQTLSCVPAILLRHSLIHATCLVSTYYMPDAMVGTEAPPQNGHPSPCPRQSAGKTGNYHTTRGRHGNTSAVMSGGDREEKLKDCFLKAMIPKQRPRQVKQEKRVYAKNLEARKLGPH